MRPARSQQRARQPERVGGDDVVVGEAMYEQQRARQLGRVGEQRRALVGVGIVRRVAEIALGVVGVVQPPVGDRSTSDGGVEDVGAAQDGERGEVAAEAPPSDGDAGQVDDRLDLSQRMQGLDLIVEDRTGQVAVHGSLPRRASTRRTPPIDHHDREALVGEPL